MNAWRQRCIAAVLASAGLVLAGCSNHENSSSSTNSNTSAESVTNDMVTHNTPATTITNTPAITNVVDTNLPAQTNR